MSPIFRNASGCDVEMVVELVESAYRGEASRAGWTTEAELLGGQRTDRQEVQELVNDPAAILRLALAVPGGPEQESAAGVGQIPRTRGACRVSPGARASEGPERTLEPLHPGLIFPLHRDKPGADFGSVLLATELMGCVLVRSEGAHAHVGMFAVRPTLQSRGLGGALLAEAERIAVERGARRVRMTVIEQRSELLAWYARRGYRSTGQTEPFPYGNPRFGLPKRDDLRFLVLAKELPPSRQGP